MQPPRLDRRFYYMLPYEEVLRSPRQTGMQLAGFLRMEGAAERMASSFARAVRPSRRAPPAADERAYASSLQMQACDPQAIWDGAPAESNPVAPRTDAGRRGLSLLSG